MLYVRGRLAEIFQIYRCYGEETKLLPGNIKRYILLPINPLHYLLISLNFLNESIHFVVVFFFSKGKFIRK